MNRIYLLFLLVFHTFYFVKANECFPKPNDKQLLYDQVGVLTAEENQNINQFLVEVSNNTSNQIVVVIVNDLCGMDKAMFATDLGHEWGVGREKDNGVVILIKPTKTNGPRTTFIAVGKGLEGIIPDATAKLIVEKEMNPLFKQGKIAQGIQNGLNVIVPLAKQEFNYVAYQEQNQKDTHFPYMIIFVVIMVVIWKLIGARSYARQNGIGIWEALMIASFFNSHGGSGRSGGFGDFSSGRGGFGGFGGGDFGGGGSGGDW